LDIGDMRRDFESAGLERDGLSDDPFRQFENWFNQAVEAGIDDPNALTLATADASGRARRPHGASQILRCRRLCFLYELRQSQGPRPWPKTPEPRCFSPGSLSTGRSSRWGRVEKVSRKESLRYFMSRPEGSQLGAWVSQQSAVIESRQALETKLERMKARFREGGIPCRNSGAATA